jgi:archaellum biogenesis ATPase FlaH
MQIERRVVIGLIISVDYLRQIQGIWNPQFLQDPSAKRIAGWCWEYFSKYHKAPGKEIEAIFDQKRQEGLPKEMAEEIGEDILPGLSEEYEQAETFNLDYLIDQTHKFFIERHLTLHQEKVQELVDEGKLTEANQMASTFLPLATATSIGLDLSKPTSLQRVKMAFDTTRQSIIKFPRQLGEFWNNQLVRGAFIALMAIEKRGKTFWLLEFAMQAHRQRAKVAFFQAGDMTEAQQIKRICVYLTQKSDLKKYAGKMWEPVRDCVYNQIDDCDRKERECDFGIFKGMTPEHLREGNILLEDLIEEHKNNPDYKCCYNCDQYESSHWGVPWIKEIDVKDPLTLEEAEKAWKEFFIKSKKTFKLATHANGTLSVDQIKIILNQWEKQDDFVPDVIIIDYADLLTTETKMEFRQQQNEIWKGLRNLSQENHCLVITATQADAKSYDQNRLKMNNFSEDKRKYAHVTAMWGLNQDTKDREKKIGLMRINEIVIREGDFSNGNEIIVLQNLRRGRPFIGSYW